MNHKRSHSTAYSHFKYTENENQNIKKIDSERTKEKSAKKMKFENFQNLVLLTQKILFSYSQPNYSKNNFSNSDHLINDINHHKKINDNKLLQYFKDCNYKRKISLDYFVNNTNNNIYDQKIQRNLFRKNLFLNEFNSNYEKKIKFLTERLTKIENNENENKNKYKNETGNENKYENKNENKDESEGINYFEKENGNDRNENINAEKIYNENSTCLENDYDNNNYTNNIKNNKLRTTNNSLYSFDNNWKRNLLHELDDLNFINEIRNNKKKYDDNNNRDNENNCNYNNNNNNYIKDDDIYNDNGSNSDNNNHNDNSNDHNYNDNNNNDKNDINKNDNDNNNNNDNNNKNNIDNNTDNHNGNNSNNNNNNNENDDNNIQVKNKNENSISNKTEDFLMKKNKFSEEKFFVKIAFFTDFIATEAALILGIPANVPAVTSQTGRISRNRVEMVLERGERKKEIVIDEKLGSEKKNGNVKESENSNYNNNDNEKEKRRKTERNNSKKNEIIIIESSPTSTSLSTSFITTNKIHNTDSVDNVSDIRIENKKASFTNNMDMDTDRGHKESDNLPEIQKMKERHPTQYSLHPTQHSLHPTQDILYSELYLFLIQYGVAVVVKKEGSSLRNSVNMDDSDIIERLDIIILYTFIFSIFGYNDIFLRSLCAT